RRITHSKGRRSATRGGAAARLGRHGRQHRDVVARAQRDRRLHTGARRLHRARTYERRHQPDAARPSQLRARHLPGARRARQTSTRRSAEDRANGLLPRRSGGALREPQTFQKTWNRSGIEFGAYIPFYPDCATTFVADTEVADRPIRIFGGTQDDYNPIALCKAYVERLKAAGRDAQLTEYRTASHAFDNVLGTVLPAVVAGGQSVRHCIIREEPIGVLINASTRHVHVQGPMRGDRPACRL